VHDLKTPQEVTCPICLLPSAQPRTHVARERWHGLPGEFHYCECARCGSLHLQAIPNLDQYYPENYYSLDVAPATRFQVFKQRLIDEVHVRSFLALCRKFGRPLRINDRLLDVGCGSGRLLKALKRLGYQDLWGVDPYLPRSSCMAGLSIVSGALQSIEAGAFDVVLFNHSLEHVIDVEQALRIALTKLKSGGVLIVRIPVPAAAWRRYGTDWVQLDAPRHVFLMTERGLDALAARVGLRVQSTVFDSGPFQFWGSEAYRKGLTLEQAIPTSLPSQLLHLFKKTRWVAAAHRLNKIREGDSASFLLRRIVE
jgi:SAM-dependent methyltransferase